MTAQARVTHREILPPDPVENPAFNVLQLTANALRQSVAEACAGQTVVSRAYYLAYEQVVAAGPQDLVEPADDDLPAYAGDVA